ncbi:hypothetical protein BV898_01854 [Hypsibius exemplaris]|uniref:Large ribosomal subunit protein uL10m n=1 Tax=Hypsibius exemplaris TaxID=2072580 RepID=A0A1W0X9V5_HYPEX|nr:hypothetical protein BV898_01854 [Hypsibius exemplaris]
MLSGRIISRMCSGCRPVACAFPSTTAPLLRPVTADQQTSERWASSANFNLKHPRSPHILKAKMLYAMRPLHAPDLRQPAETCRRTLPKTDVNRPPTMEETVRAREVRKILDASQMVVLCHKNPTSGLEMRAYRNAIWKLNMRIWPVFHSRDLRLAFEGGPYANMIPILEGDTLLVTSSDLNFGNLYRGLRRIATAVPLVVVVNAQYVLSIPQLETFAKRYKTGIVEAHGELLSVLSNPTSSLVQALQHEAMTLSKCLDFAAAAKGTTAAEPTGEAVTSLESSPISA